MEITFQETKADLKLLRRLVGPGLPIVWLLRSVAGAMLLTSLVLAAGDHWMAGVAVAMILLLLTCLWISKAPGVVVGGMRTIRVEETHFEQCYAGEIHQNAIADNIAVQPRRQYWVLRRDRVVFLIIPKRAVAAGQMAGLADKLERLGETAESIERAAAVPLWNDACERAFVVSVEHSLAPEDFSGEAITMYTGKDEAQDAKPVQEGIAARPTETSRLMWIFVVVTMSLGAGAIYFGRPDDLIAVGIAIGVSLILPGAIFLMVDSLARKKFLAASPSIFHREQLFALDYAGIWMGSARSFSFVPWKNFREVMVGTKRLVGLQHTDGLVYVIPKSALGTEEAVQHFLDFSTERIAAVRTPADARPDSGNPYESPRL
jgi:hypothetical protein